MLGPGLPGLADNAMQDRAPDPGGNTAKVRNKRMKQKYRKPGQNRGKLLTADTRPGATQPRTQFHQLPGTLLTLDSKGNTHIPDSNGSPNAPIGTGFD